MDGADADLDTETLLALLSSLLHPSEFEHPVLLDALVKSQGDVQAAARSLRSQSPCKKRKVSQNTGLHGWLKSGDKSGPSPPQDRLLSSASVAHGLDQSTRKRKRAFSPTISGTDVSRGGESSSSSMSPRKPSSKTKAVTNTEFMALFRPPNSSDSPSKPQITRYPPLTLVSPEHVAQHAPCTLHNSILPQELACRYV